GPKLTHYRSELLACRGQMVVNTISALASLDDTAQLELSQSAAEQRPRHARYAAMQIIERSTAAQQFAQYQRGPALRKYLCRLGQRTVLTVALSHVRLARGNHWN